MSFNRSRLRRAESTVRNSSGCPECGLPPDAPGRIVYSDSTGIGLPGLPENPDERCAECGRRLWLVIAVVHEEEGEGGEPY
jgi:ribosomal protein S14